jgi:crotonobetainyl-CoA:carnitine CoA-transferase CaiB-like acyl-CoA transferase
MLWTMAEPLLSEQLGASPQPAGNRSELYAPHGAYRCAGDDHWISLAVRDDQEWRRLCAVVGALSPLSRLGFAQRVEQRQAIDDALSGWARLQDAAIAEKELLQAGIPAAALARSVDLVHSDHLHERGFWDPHGSGVLPGLPWRASFGRVCRPAPKLGADGETVLRDLLGVSLGEIAKFRQSGALG